MTAPPRPREDEAAQPPAGSLQAVETACHLAERLTGAMADYMGGRFETVERMAVAFLAGGHILLEGPPGVGKTRLCNALARAVALDVRRVAMTPDMMPSDLTGSQIVDRRGMAGRFRQGPVFANVVVADGLNRATPRTQSALLEAMQERQVTVGGRAHPLPEPFAVIACQDPRETEGTRRPAEALIDRFMVSLPLGRPTLGKLADIAGADSGDPSPQPVIDAADLAAFRQTASAIVVAPPVLRYACELVAQVDSARSAEASLSHRVRLGGGPRSAQALMALGRVSAMASRRVYVSRRDITHWIEPVLRHRLSMGVGARDTQRITESIAQLTRSFELS